MKQPRPRKHGVIVMFLLSSALVCQAAERYPVSGLVVMVDKSRHSFVVSCQNIPGYMDAMVMRFGVEDAKELDGISPGNSVDFTLVVEKTSSYARQIQIRRYESAEQDPLAARRLKLLNLLSRSGSAASALAVGQTVPDFALTDQSSQRISLSEFSGKVVAINFIYTSCALPNFCFRNSNTFGVLARRFHEQMGRELVLLTVTFDPQRDQPGILAKYAKTWNADPARWHFLTGPVAEVGRVSQMFGMDYFPDEGLMNHSLHTAVIDRQGKLVANIEGNLFTADQLGDLVQSVLGDAGARPRSQARLARSQAAASPAPAR